jgi:integral membrane protein (TIGR01906 family)
MLARRAGAELVALAMPVVIVAVMVALFFNPAYVALEQDRAQADAWTGFTRNEVHAVTNSVLGQIYFGPPAFDQALGGKPVFDERERAHLADVRTVLLGFGLLTLIAGAILAVAGAASRGAGWYWRAVRRGSVALALLIVAGGILFYAAFDAMFDLFHRVFFASGSYTFDPSTERLVQLFPDKFWTDTSIALAVVGFALCLLVRRLAGRRTAEPPASQPIETTGSLSSSLEDAR